MQFCRVDVTGHTWRITIRRPEVMNALHPPASHELASVWDAFAADNDAWIAVFTGEGERAFSAGNDLKATAASDGVPGEGATALPPSGFGGITNRFDLFKPVIARVNGVAVGGGFEMALACDIILAAEHATFGLPEPRVGLLAGALGVHRFPRQAPFRVAMGHMLSGLPMTAARAYELGIINEVAPLASLDDVVERWVQAILACSPLSVRATKEAATRGLDLPLAEAAVAHYAGIDRLVASNDIREGPRAFAEKRPPRWQGA